MQLLIFPNKLSHGRLCLIVGKLLVVPHFERDYADMVSCDSQRAAMTRPPRRCPSFETRIEEFKRSEFSGYEICTTLSVRRIEKTR